MEQFREILLDVWREACRHIEIQESASTITNLLKRNIPLAQLLIKRIDPVNRSLDLAAFGLPEMSTGYSENRIQCSPNSVTRDFEVVSNESRRQNAIATAGKKYFFLHSSPSR